MKLLSLVQGSSQNLFYSLQHYCTSKRKKQTCQNNSIAQNCVSYWMDIFWGSIIKWWCLKLWHWLSFIFIDIWHFNMDTGKAEIFWSFDTGPALSEFCCVIICILTDLLYLDLYMKVRYNITVHVKCCIPFTDHTKLQCYQYRYIHAYNIYHS